MSLDFSRSASKSCLYLSPIAMDKFLNISDAQVPCLENGDTNTSDCLRSRGEINNANTCKMFDVIVSYKGFITTKK
jgi:hypothetical protein